MSTTLEKLALRDKVLAEYEKNIGIPLSQAPGTDEELEQYLKMDRVNIEKLSTDECGIIAMRLAQYAFHIQRAQNREQARVTWAKNEINLCTADIMQGYNGYGREEKLWQAIKGNDYAKSMNSIMIQAQQRVDRLSFMASGLNNLAEMVKSIKFNKMRADK